MTLITIFLGGFFVMIDPGFTFGELSIFTALAWALSNPMRALGNLINDLQRFSASAAKIIEVYYSRPLIMDRPDAEDHPKMQGKIEFDDVSFSFGKVKVLDHISFTVQPGQTLAVMGPTGSGKTTLLNLLDRFYDVDSGCIRVDDCDVRFWKLQQLCAHRRGHPGGLPVFGYGGGKYRFRQPVADRKGRPGFCAACSSRRFCVQNAGGL